MNMHNIRWKWVYYCTVTAAADHLWLWYECDSCALGCHWLLFNILL